MAESCGEQLRFPATSAPASTISDVPNYLRRSLTAEQFVESAGVILFNMSLDQVCILLHQGDYWVLSKGRRNCGEIHQAAALREAKEETGYTCRLLPVRMSTRAPPANEDDTSLPNEARQMNDLTEPFELSLRGLGKAGLKLVWLFIAIVDEAEPPSAGENMFQPQFLPGQEAMEKLTFQGTKRRWWKRLKSLDSSSSLFCGWHLSHVSVMSSAHYR